MQHAGVHEALDDLGEVALGQSLSGGDVVRLHDGARLAQRELVHGADGVVSLSRKPHRQSLWTNKAYLSSWRRWRSALELRPGASDLVVDPLDVLAVHGAVGLVDLDAVGDQS